MHLQNVSKIFSNMLVAMKISAMSVLIWSFVLNIFLSVAAAGPSRAQGANDESSEGEESAASESRSKSKSKSKPVPITSPSKPRTPDETLSKESLALTPDQTSWWSPKGMQHSIGVELSDASFGVLGTQAIAYGFMVDKLGVDLYFAHSKDANTSTSSITRTSNDASTPKTLTVVQKFTGTDNHKKTTFGVQPKYVFFADRWFKASVGFMLAYTPKSSVRYRTGTISTTYADATSVNNYSVSESSFGSISSSISSKTLYGPRISTEFYLKWFPHIALGFGTGLILSSGADATTDTSTQSRSYTVTNGVVGTPTTAQTTSASETTKTNGTAKTVAIGGTTFSLLGNFSLRYIW
jgi:hypothetical protein